MKTLLILEHDNHQLKSSNFHTLSAAVQLGQPIEALILGYQCQEVVKQAQRLPGIQRILVADHLDYEYQLAENCSQCLVEISQDYHYIMTSAGTFGKNLLPRVAALLDMAMIGDVIKIVSPDTFIRPIYAGNAFATVQSIDPIKLITVRTTTFPKQDNTNNATIPIYSIEKSYPNTLSKFIKYDLTALTRPELTSARIVVAGGRGLKSAENFKLLEKLADQLGAALGASRAAVDAGFAPNDYQVGQTGKVVAPELYIAIGISGAIQHLAGMKDSKIIVAINNDPDAPIFQIADYGLVADLFLALKELEQELESIDNA